ncbi:MAG: amidohydrolase [Melioribacteraceae bacterium]|nr:amidohydrolase [Melioribacteraceae bacterium]MCF8356981.1 amidohydrolase [Melioribacteraceae bacterium]MCF8396446.1 amidohydrolase [Melioribacteraceae bacterium]MCF8421191.1 amidohydrolase [Melioribacteraceae bacterium]
MTSTVNQLSAETINQLVELYEHLHQNPEISKNEIETAETITGNLEAFGYDVHKKIGGNGFAAVLKNGDGNVYLYRTDLDALPIKEKTGLPYKSTKIIKDESGRELPVMHACGHDLHMTVFTGTAKFMAENIDKWNGTLIMLGQPAEEIGSGASSMIDDGLYDMIPKPDACLAFHIGAELKTGTIGYTPGYAWASVDMIDIIVHGIGGHAAYPDKTIDPIVMASEIVLSLQKIVSREINPLDSAVISVGSIQGGTKHNIIPDSVKLQLTIRTYKEEVHKHIIESIRRTINGIASAYGMHEDKLPELIFKDAYTPPLFNDPLLLESIIEPLENVVGKENLIEIIPQMGGEDFGKYGADGTPICMLRLGIVNEKVYEEHRIKKKKFPSLHSPYLTIEPEPTIKTGVLVMSSVLIHLFNSKK